MNESLFVKALTKDNDCSVIEGQIKLLDSSNQFRLANATNYSYAYIDGQNIYFVDNDKWNRVVCSLPI